MRSAMGAAVLLVWLAVPPQASGWSPPDQETKSEEIRQPVYTGGSMRLQVGGVATMDLKDDAAMRVVWKGGDWSLPYGKIQTLYVSLSRPTALVELAGATYGASLFGLFKNRKLYLSVRFEDTDGASQTCLFLLPPGSGELVELLATKSGHGVVFESHEARRTMEGKK